jgi:hypothetical protein
MACWLVVSTPCVGDNTYNDDDDDDDDDDGGDGDCGHYFDDGD